MINSSIKILKGIGEKRLISFNEFGIYTIKDLLYHFPYKYKDITLREYFLDKMNGDEVVAFVKIASKPYYKRKSSSLNFLSFYVSDGQTKAKCTFFNQPYLLKQINKDDELLIYGTIKREGASFQLVNPKIIRPDETTPSILTQYRLPNTIKQKSFVSVLEKAFAAAKSQLTETLPENLRIQYNLCTVNFAIEQIHFPVDMLSLESARKRLAFEEMFYFVLVLRRLRSTHQMQHGAVMKYDSTKMTKLDNLLPYSLTSAQLKVIDEITDDMTGQNSKAHVMNRLLQGDVGCGKTAVAMYAIYLCYINGYQSAMMAPTEILVNQHFAEFQRYLSPLGVKVAKLTSSMSTNEKNIFKEELANGNIDLVVGTHALIQAGVEFSNLALAITDEQHRFGVNQRAMLSKKGESPHMLVMSATPVPRTLALILYGDLDISTIDELPPGRKKVETRIVDISRRNDMYKYIAEQISADQQAYIVCPLIDESEKLDVASATETYNELKKTYFKNINIGLIHGKMTDEEKQGLLEEFAFGKMRALISTTVIEVGVNVPSATIMVVENAERFGLAQLHQLRGRVGRSDKKSWCFMTTETNNPTSLERLNIISNENDGFVISQKDLDLRGPGQFIGMRQSGLLDNRVLSLINNYDLVKQVKEAVDKAESGEFGDCMNELLKQAKERYTEKFKDIVLN
ncbi:MAG: ATP-dependent DNA helicase RecG [Eubacteriales bacterium]